MDYKTVGQFLGAILLLVILLVVALCVGSLAVANLQEVGNSPQLGAPPTRR
jgi:hypothetical protein